MNLSFAIKTTSPRNFHKPTLFTKHNLENKRSHFYSNKTVCVNQTIKSKQPRVSIDYSNIKKLFTSKKIVHPQTDRPKTSKRRLRNAFFFLRAPKRLTHTHRP